MINRKADVHCSDLGRFDIHYALLGYGSLVTFHSKCMNVKPILII